jgi:hypothetical protein
MKMLRSIGALSLLLGLVACGGGGHSNTAVPTATPAASVTISPGSAVLALGASQGFSATGPGGTPVAVNWSLSTPTGTLQPSGSMAMYTAPNSFPSPNSVTVIATLQSDASKMASAPVSVVFPNDNHGGEAVPVKMGSSGGNATDVSGNFCCSGTLGALISRGGVTYILSNNHVLAKSDNGTAKTTDPVTQPGLVDNNCNPGTVIAHFSAAAALKPTGGSTGPAPSNVDAAIAQIVTGTVDTSGSILDLGPAGATSIAAAPPSSTLAVPANVLAANEGVAKSGRSSGLTCSTLQSISTTVQVDYDSSCGGGKAFTATFNNQVIVNGGSFSAGGDSGSLVVTADTARPLALLYGGNNTSTSGNPIADVIAAFTNASGTPAIVGGGDHAVSCDPTASAPSASQGPGASAAALPVSERQRTAAARQKHAARLMQDPAVQSVEAGVSEDNPGEGAVVITLAGAPHAAVPQTLDGVRTRVVRPGQAIPLLNQADVDQATAVKESHAGLMTQPGIQGIGVGRSSDNPAETAIVIYVLAGQAHAPIPALLDGVRTKIVEGSRFKAFGWGKETKPATRCTKR